ncbi:phosphatase PAP2 family protein [Granulosicoccus antarcticus]|uniref:undecaprenyl-diphosphate phosphatase n=1 Tax=Granulosicoccus antarcticus IMCC3135 TaxID=1192854 RepID=A0A2Z2NYZ3_9GAMM|nr:phosphatase PAP2 family protein [Granulosicoccus antarcticus]ASJ76672.1 hypothetical protein IMCC3135_33140 [Granulosicoccus antarcticus IMCC3135]
MPFPSAYNQPATALIRHIIGIALALSLFLILLLLVTQVPAISEWDSRLSQWSQQLRGPAIDRIMLSVTLMGDTLPATLLVGVVVISLLWVRRWWLGVHLACVGLSTALSVSIIKTLIGRVRPVIVDGGLHSFSFPSGHATTAALVTGLLALLLAYRQTATTRYVIYAVATLMACLIAYSRVHLLAHWPTDVIAGLALGYALVMAFGWQLHVGPELNYRYQWPLLGTSALLMLIYVALNFSAQAQRYGLG